MKKLLAAILLMGSLNILAGDIKVEVSGMVCSMCAQGIQKKFKARPEVHHLNVNLDNNLVHIHTAEGKDLPDEVIKKLITEAGYNVANITR